MCKLWMEREERLKMKNHIQKKILLAGLLAGVLSLCAGCAAGQGEKDTKEELNNLAEIRIYTAADGKLIQTITDEDRLYQYNQSASLEDSNIEERQEELEEALEGAKEQYELVSYKYPAARFGDKELEEVMTLTLYEGNNIIKMTVADESIKAFSLPEELLTFYEEVSEEDMAFYRSLAED